MNVKCLERFCESFLDATMRKSIALYKQIVGRNTINRCVNNLKTNAQYQFKPFSVLGLFMQIFPFNFFKIDLVDLCAIGHKHRSEHRKLLNEEYGDD